MKYDFCQTKEDVAILASIFNCTEDDIIAELYPAYSIDREERPELFEKWSNLSFNVEPPTYNADVDENYDKCFTFGIYYEPESDCDPVTLQTVMTDYGCACEQHFNEDLLRDFSGSLWAMREDALEECADEPYTIRVSNNNSTIAYLVSADDFHQMLEGLETDKPIQDKMAAFMNTIKEKGLVIENEPNQHGSVWNTGHDEEEQEID